MSGTEIAAQAGARTVPTPGSLYARFLRRAHEVLAESAPVLNAMNVFPVSDADTGTNLQLTLAGVVAALDDSANEETGADAIAGADRLAQAAVLSAHGNSGAIVAEMLVSITREIAAGGLAVVDPGVGVARLLRVAADSASHAVAHPVPGTILTVADDTAAAAEETAAQDLDDVPAVLTAARLAAAASLARTPSLLPVLADAGVVDAGAQGYVLLLDVLAETLGGEPATPLRELSTAVVRDPGRSESNETRFEVMYTVRGAGAAALDALRIELSQRGESVVVVGNEVVAQVHVHLADAGAAVEAGLLHGSLSQIRIAGLPSEAGRTGRTVIAVVAGVGLAEVVRSLGGVPVLPGGSRVSVEELSAALDAHPGDLVVLPNDMESLELLHHLVEARRTLRRRIAVIPTVAQVQGLTALAVHEPSADFDSAVVAMSNTAGHTRHGAVTVAETRAMTMAGRCEVGDVLGLLDGDFVEIGDSVAEVAERIIARLTSAGGEVLTLISGADADPELVQRLAGRCRRADLEVEVVAGGQRRYPLLIGLD